MCADTHLGTERETLLHVAEGLLADAKRHGAEAADVMASHGTDFEVKVADGAIVTLTQATAKGLGLRVFVDGRMGFCTTSDFTSASLARVAERAVALAREAAPDEHNGLADAAPTRIDSGDDLDLFDPAVTELSAETKIAWAHALERSARSVDPRVSRFRDSGVGNGVSVSVLVTSTGAIRTQRNTAISLWCNPIACERDELQTEVWYDAKSHVDDLETVEAIGQRAGRRAVRMLGARKIKTQQVPVIFEPQESAGLVAGLVGALDGDMVFKRATFLADKLHNLIAVPALSIVDEPHLRRGLGSCRFDGEGLETRKRALVDQGKLAGFLYDSYTARKACVSPTASARRGWNSLPSAGTFNLTLLPGAGSLASMIKESPKALLVTRGLGRGLNSVSGEYSRGANGLWIEHGEIVHPVQEVTIAGDFIEMLQTIDRVGADVERRGTIGAPSLRIAEMTVSGG